MNKKGIGGEVTVEFFKASDFIEVFKDFFKPETMMQSVANISNAKLEREGIIVTTDEYDPSEKLIYKWYQHQQCVKPIYTALLINVKEIKRCEHNPEKIKQINLDLLQMDCFQCECGAKVKPIKFEVVK